MKKKLLLGLFALAFGGGISLHAQNVTFTATGGDKFGEGEGCQKVLDHDLSSKWFNTGNDRSLLFEASETVSLTGYTFVTANDNSNYGRVPKEWELLGSNDEAAKTDADHSSWIRIQYVREDNVMQHANKTAYYYAINTAASYKYYKLKIVYGDGDNNSFQIAEFIPAYVPAFVPSYTAVDGVGGTGSEGYPSVADGSVETKLCTNYAQEDESTYYFYFIFRRDEAVAVSSYKFCTGNDANNRDPKNWELYGMNTSDTPGRTDAGWVLIDSKTDQSLTTVRSTWTDPFSATGDYTTAYNTFMLKITSVRGGGNMTQFQEFRLNDDASGYTALDGVGGTGNEGYAKGFDGDTGTKVCTNSRVRDQISYLWESPYVIFRAAKDLAVAGYSFATGNDAPDRDPKSWTLYGMKSATQPARDDAGWTAIDTKENQEFTTERKVWIHFDVDNPTAEEYNFFKLEITANNGASLIQFADFQLDGITIVSENRLVPYMGFASSNLFDGNPGTYFSTKMGGDYGAYGTFGPADGNAVSISGYSLQTTDRYYWYDRHPKSWTLYGGNDRTVPEAIWEEIDKVTGDTQLADKYCTYGHYHLDAPSKAYKYFKLVIDETQGANDTELAEVVLHYAHDVTTPWMQINDGTAPVFNGTVTVENFNYSRTFANEWATVCLPFDTHAKTGFQPYTLTESVDDERGEFLKVTSNDYVLAAYTPSIVKTAGANAEVDFSGSNVTVYGTLDNPSAETNATGWTIVGSTANNTILPADAAGTVYYIAQNKFWEADANGVQVNAMRAYLMSNGTGAKSFGITEEDITGIKTVESEEWNAAAPVYDLQGRRVNNAQRGVYIQNGKKFVVK